jgi:hypothetical protein
MSIPLPKQWPCLENFIYEIPPEVEKKIKTGTYGMTVDFDHARRSSTLTLTQDGIVIAVLDGVEKKEAMD